jgi:CubicO group peptidase (beta-lactamase class C family)
MRVLSLDRDRDIAPERTGVFTSRLVWIFQEHRIALFFTGCKHASENLAVVLQQRSPDLPRSIQMCDALSRNEPKVLGTSYDETQMPIAVRASLLFIIGLHCFAAEPQSVFPGADWEHVAKPESIGYSSAKLDALRGWLKTQVTKGLVVSVGGRVLFEYGDVAYPSIVASVRKSVLGMLYGKYIFNGTIDLRKSVKELGLDDVHKFLPREEHASLEMLLMSRSGIYHPEGAPDPDPTDNPPARGSQHADAFFYYNNWDFNAAGTAFEKLTGKNIYEALQTDLALPIGMQDYDVKRQKKVTDMPYSVHPMYHMWLSTRDMARLGLLMLRHGDWNGKSLIPEQWVEWMTQLTTHASEIFPVSLRDAETAGPTRWGYGKMWWVWDQPRLPGGAWISGDFYGAYQAWGIGGQFITVLPMHDVVIAHKVEIEGDSAADMPVLEQATLIQMILAAHCIGPCK